MQAQERPSQHLSCFLLLSPPKPPIPPSRQPLTPLLPIPALRSAIDIEWTPLLKFHAFIGNCVTACAPFAKIVPAVRAEDMNADPKVRLRSFL